VFLKLSKNTGVGDGIQVFRNRRMEIKIESNSQQKKKEEEGI